MRKLWMGMPIALGVAWMSTTAAFAAQPVAYHNDFTTDSDIWKASPLGKEIDSVSKSGGLSLERKTEGAESYLRLFSDNEKHRGQRLTLSDAIVKGADVSFDWKMEDSGKSGYGEVMLFSPANWNSYFTLHMDENYQLSYYTKCSLANASTKQESFEGAIALGQAEKTGLGGQGTWLHVQLHFDYLKHTADLQVTFRDDPSQTYEAKNIPIDTQADGLSTWLMRKDMGVVSMGIDGMNVEYTEFSKNDMVSVENAPSVTLTRAQYKTFSFPKEVTVVMGDGKKKNVPVKEWKAEPKFQADQDGEYVWKAQLNTGKNLSNQRDLTASFSMSYSQLPYPVAVQNPNTLELEYGKALPSLPEEVSVIVSDGSRAKMKVDHWEPIRAFDAEKEGIYVWGANLKAEDGKFQIKEEKLAKNEFHEKRSERPFEEDPQAYQYQVYYRVNYTKKKSKNTFARSMEKLERGVYAVSSEKGIFVSWRLLATEYAKGIAFDVYRNGEKINAEPITDKTNYLDTEGKPQDLYTVHTILDGKEATSKAFAATNANYLEIPLQKPAPQPNIDGKLAEYTINDMGVADVDGDGEYEMIVKWYPTNAFDSGTQTGTSSPTIFDVYRMDGTPLWRLNLGLEMPSGAHFNQFLFYDMDEDGKAELFLKTSDGSRSYRPNAEGKFDETDESTLISYVGDRNVVPGSNLVGGKNGHVSPKSNEYVTVFNGQTGEVIDSITFVNPTQTFEQWGDNYGNRASRYNMALAYLPKDSKEQATIPAALLERGYYERTTVAAYTLRDGKLTLEWNFVAPTDTQYAGKGNHNMATGDLDQDGFDELVIGSMALDHDGSVLWAKDGQDGQDLLGHGDAIHLAAMNPKSDDLYVFAPQEEKFATLNYSLSNAKNGGRIAGVWGSQRDTGRGVAANITPQPGFEYWASAPNSENPSQIPAGSIYNFFGDVVAEKKPLNFSTNWTLYWDGDLLSELGDGENPSKGDGAMAVYKYNWQNNTMDTLEIMEGTKTNNGTKNNSCLSADLLGDWREELVLRSADDSSVRIYFTDEATDYMIYTLMHDPVYRNAVANQNSSYNQPPHLGFYLGEDERDRVLEQQLPTPKIQYAGEE